ncbi:MAG TPA: YciI family protein [Thermoanaerobaculia bacterium]|jgi:hypothetical protein|nr:YciI family protein [Thermoanaerobaculia bacterium]
MLLIYSSENQPNEEQEAATIAGHRAVLEEAARRGSLVSASPLEPTSTATTVRVTGGQTLVSDGPFAETKEQLAGYYILDCADLDEAIEWAARIPTACLGGGGCVEIRPLRAMSSANAELLTGVSSSHG